MDITILPVSKSSNIIKDSFLTQLSRRVDVEGNASNRNIQILIFKPVGRPMDDFDHIIKIFINTGKRLDDDTIFITAMKPDRCKFEPPLDFKFALQTRVFVNDENDIEQGSDNAFDEIANLLIRKYGFQSSSRGTSGRDTLPTKANTKVNFQKKETQTQENKRLKKEVERLQRRLCDLERKTKKACKDRSKEIRFEVQSARIPLLGCFIGQITHYDVSLYAVEDEIANIENGLYKFQRKYEKKCHLEPGTLRKILEYIPREWKKVSGNGFIIEGQSFESLIAQVNDTFRLPPDRFKRLLKRIYERHNKGKGKQRPLCRDNTALDIGNETYPGYGATSSTL